MKRFSLIFEAPLNARLREEEMGPIGNDELLVETMLTLISTGTEMTIYTGDFPQDSAWAGYADYPHRPGYSHVGRALEIGGEVEGFSEGDTVFSWAGHSSHAIMPAEKFTRVPDDIRPERAVFGTLSQIALNGVRLGGIALGDSVVIAGVGPVGILALEFARLSGAYPVVALDLHDGRLERALEHGADFAVNPSRQDVVEGLSRATRGRMADTLYDVTGSPRFTPMGLKLLKRGGKMVILGSPRGSVEVDFHNEVHLLGLQIIGAHNSMHVPVETHANQWTLARDLELFFDLLRTGRMSVDGLVSHTYPWKDAPQAYELLNARRGDTMCLMLDWSACAEG